MKKIKFLLVVLIMAFSISLTPAQNLPLMPYPKSVKQLNTNFRLDKEFTLFVEGNPNERIYPAATRMLRRLSDRTGLFFPQDVITSTTKTESPPMVISVKRPGKVILNEDESYQLFIYDNKIQLMAETDLGAMHGFETLLQLLSADENGYYLPAVEIEDQPRFPWRGLMIDACRHFMPINMVKRNLDAMAAVKMNVLHWHLSEDQGFRVESKVYPKLHQLGSDGLYYSHAQIKDVIEYAAARGIRVYPEFDVPGHATSWFAAYPEFASAPGPYTIERNWGIFDPTFDPTNEETYTFLNNFFGEMAALFPDEYFHIGGDEVNGKQWDANESIQKFMNENNIPDNHALQTYFNQRILKILTKHGKKMIGWDEIFQPGMPQNIVIHSWRGTKALMEAAQKGYRSILSNGYYIDLIQPTDFHYLNDPIPADSPLSEKEKKNILGGEATMWSELVTHENVDSRIWPRTAAIAERLWSPQNINDVDTMYKRIERISFLLEEHGLLHIKNYEMMLRRLTNNNDITYLKTLVDLIEPVKIYTRHRQGVKYTSFSPYTRVVDAARPDADAARKFRNEVDRYLADPMLNSSNLIPSLLRWVDNHSKLMETIKLSPILKEIEPLSHNLSKIASLALEAIEYINNNRPTPQYWVEQNLDLIEEAKKPYGQAELMLVSAVEKLVLTAGKN
jgi:hexosaminidase